MSANQIRKEGPFVRVEGPQSNVVWLNILDAQEAVRLLAAPPSEAPATISDGGFDECRLCGVRGHLEGHRCAAARPEEHPGAATYITVAERDFLRALCEVYANEARLGETEHGDRVFARGEMGVISAARKVAQ